MAFSPDSTKLAAGQRYDNVCLLSLDGTLIRHVPCASKVESLQFMPDGSGLLVPNRRPSSDGQTPGILQIWREDLSHVERELEYSIGKHPANMTNASSSPCGRFLAATDYDRAHIILNDGRSSRILGTTPKGRITISDVDYSPNGDGLLVGYFNGVVESFRIERMGDDEVSLAGQQRVVRSHQGKVTSVCFVNSNLVASAGDDGRVRLWDFSQDAPQSITLSDSDLRHMAWSPDGSLLACGYEDEYVIAEASGSVVTRLPLDSPSGRIAWSPTGDAVAVCTHSDKLTVLNRQGKRLFSILHDGVPQAIAFSPDGRELAVIGRTHLQVCRADDGREIHRQPPSGERGLAVAYSSDGRHLAIAGLLEAIVIGDARNHRVKRDLPCEFRTDCIAFSPDGRLLATGHEDSLIRIWDVSSGLLKVELGGHVRGVLNVGFSPDGRTLLSSMDGTMRLWSLRHGRAYGVLNFVPSPEGDPDQAVMPCYFALSAATSYLAITRDEPGIPSKVLLVDLHDAVDDRGD